MKIITTIAWNNASAKGRIEVSKGGLFTGYVCLGAGKFTEDGRFSFSSKGPSCISIVLEAEKDKSGHFPAVVSIKDTKHPFSFALKDVLKDGSMRIPERGVELTAREKSPRTGGLPLYKGFTKEQIKQFGPVRKYETVPATERHLYVTPFLYRNVTVGDFYEIDVPKGIEFKADTGFITIREEKPIVAVTVIGSGCDGKQGYNICEWWGEGEGIDQDNIKNQLVKRQRIDNLSGTHPSILLLMLMKMFEGLDPDHGFRYASEGDMAGTRDALKKLSMGYYEGLYMGFYENVANFQVGPPYPKKVTIRCGCKVTECPGTSMERYPAEYAIRVV